MTAEAGQRKLAPTTLYGLAEKNYTEQFTAWISKEASNPTPEGARSHSARVTFGGTAFAACLIQQLTRRHVSDPAEPFFGVAKIQNKVVAVAARIRFTGGLKPVISRKVPRSCICSGRREKILVSSQVD